MTGRLELDGLEIALAACVALVTAVSLKVTKLALLKVGLMFVRWDSPFSPLEPKIKHSNQNLVYGNNEIYFTC